VAPTAEPQLTLSSSAFDSGAGIPLRYAQRTFGAAGGWTVTCPGENVSPPLDWTNVPPGTESLTITCLDHIDLCEKCEPLAPQDRAWPHWGIYNIAPTSGDLPAGQPAEPSLPDGTVQVVNGYGEVGYGGPCPPPGHTHTYVFTLYALDTTLDLPERVQVEDLITAMEGHILAHAELQGTFLGR
jgi:Raf kinase inhibitor-like YbhB/YbcL family protein